MIHRLFLRDYHRTRGDLNQDVPPAQAAQACKGRAQGGGHTALLLSFDFFNKGGGIDDLYAVKVLQVP